MTDTEERYELLLEASRHFPYSKENPGAVGYVAGFMLGVRCALLDPEVARDVANHVESVAGHDAERIEVMNRQLADLVVGEDSDFLAKE